MFKCQRACQCAFLRVSKVNVFAQQCPCTSMSVCIQGGGLPGRAALALPNLSVVLILPRVQLHSQYRQKLCTTCSHKPIPRAALCVSSRAALAPSCSLLLDSAESCIYNCLQGSKSHKRWVNIRILSSPTESGEIRVNPGPHPYKGPYIDCQTAGYA